MTLRRILIPIDFSAGSLAAVRFAQEFAALSDSYLHLLHVIEPTLSGTMPSSFGTNQEEACCDRSLQAYHRVASVISHSRLDPFRTTGLVRKGVPEQAIAAYAAEIHADLIVMGIHGQEQAVADSPGRVIEHVLGRAACPVLAVPEATDSAVWARQPRPVRAWLRSEAAEPARAAVA